MKLQLNTIENKTNKYGQPFVALTFSDPLTHRTWRFWLWEWIHNRESTLQHLWSAQDKLIPFEYYDVKWKEAEVFNTPTQILTQLDFVPDYKTFCWK